MFPQYLADIAPPMGKTRDFDYCVSLNNLPDYPEYLIVAQISLPGAPALTAPIILEPGTCLSMGRVYNRPQITLFALPKSQVSPDELFALESNMERIIDARGNFVGVANPANQHTQYFNPKIQAQVQQSHREYGVREGDRILPTLYPGTVLKFAQLLNIKGIPTSHPIRKPSTAPFWDAGKTVEGHYTITSLTDSTFTIEEIGREVGWNYLFVLPLLGMILLVMLKWNRKRFKLKAPEHPSGTPNDS